MTAYSPRLSHRKCMGQLCPLVVAGKIAVKWDGLKTNVTHRTLPVHSFHLHGGLFYIRGLDRSWLNPLTLLDLPWGSSLLSLWPSLIVFTLECSITISTEAISVLCPGEGRCEPVSTPEHLLGFFTSTTSFPGPLFTPLYDRGTEAQWGSITYQK